DGDWVGAVIEDLDGHPAGIAGILERLEDRHEVGGAETGAAAIDVVGVEVAGGLAVAADEVGRRAVVGAHGLDVQVQGEARVRWRTAASGDVICSPSVLASSQCRPMIVRPHASASWRSFCRAAALTSVMRGASVNGAISRPS